MGKTTQVRVDNSLVDVFGNIGKNFADKVKKEYNLDSLYVSYATSSQILAAKYRGAKSIKFRVNKTSAKSGVLIIE